MPDTVVTRSLLILLVLALVASLAIPAFASDKQVHHLAGDFNGDGVATPGLFVNGLFVLSGATSRGETLRFRYGRAKDVPVVGDWNGDGVETVGVVRRGRQWFLSNSNTAGVADLTFTYGGWLGSDEPVVGDWTGKGVDRPGVVRGNTWHLRNSLAGGDADITFRYGRPGRSDQPVVGDWNGNGVDTVGVVRKGRWLLKNTHAGGQADWGFWYGRASDVPVVGSWDGRTRDTPGVVRGSTWLLKNRLGGGSADLSLNYPEAKKPLAAPGSSKVEVPPSSSPETTNDGRGAMGSTGQAQQPNPSPPADIAPPPAEPSVDPTAPPASEQGATGEDSGEDASDGSVEGADTGNAVDAVSRPASAFASLLSEDELAMQRARMSDGPFRTPGDFSANSPGHWGEMAAAMKLDFSAARWQGPRDLGSDGRVLHLHESSSQTVNDPPGDVRRMAHDMMSAAYAAAITQNHTVAAAITKEIEYQATRPNLDYSNRTLWPFDYYDDLNPLFMHAVWVKDYVLAYDITKAMGHSSPIVEQWFLDLAELSEQIVHENLGAVFPNRKRDSYDSRASFVDTTMFRSTRSADGAAVDYPRITLFYNNRRSNQAGLYGLVGVVLDNDRYKEEFKRYAREWLMFGHRVTSTDGISGDVNRGKDSFPQLGFLYGVHGLESLVPAMDGLARQGDVSLYEFSSSEGARTPRGSTSHFKTMEGVFDTYIRWIEGSYPAQYTGSGNPPSTSVVGNEYFRIQSRNTANGREIVGDAALLLPANYYNRTDWYDVIMRKGTPTGFSAVPQNIGSIDGWRTDWRHRFLRSLETEPYPVSS